MNPAMGERRHWILLYLKFPLVYLLYLKSLRNCHCFLNRIVQKCKKVQDASVLNTNTVHFGLFVYALTKQAMWYGAVLCWTTFWLV